MPPANAKEKDQADLWDKLASLEDDSPEVEVVIDRVLPETDQATGFPIGGYCGEVRGHGLNRQAVFEITGGGTYNLLAKTAKDRQFFGQIKVKFPGAPKFLLPGGQSSGAQVPAPASTSQGNGNGNGRGNYSEGYSAGLAAAQEQNRFDRLEQQIVDLKERGNGHDRMDPLELAKLIINSIPKTNGNGESLGIKDALALLERGEKRGEGLAAKMFELTKKYEGNPDSMVEAELVGTLRDLVNNASRGAKFKKADARVMSTKDPNAQAAKCFIEIRDGLADILEKRFTEGDLAEPAKAAAQTIRGARTIGQLLTATDGTVEFVADYANDFDDEPEQPEGPDTPAPGKDSEGTETK